MSLKTFFIISFLTTAGLTACTNTRTQLPLDNAIETTDTDSIPHLPRYPDIIDTHSPYPEVVFTIDSINAFSHPIDSIITRITNNSNYTVSFGEMYWLEREDNGSWHEILPNQEYLDGNIAIIFNAVAYLLAPHSTTTHTNHTQPYNRTITPGKYRIYKLLRLGDSRRQDTAYVEFQIQ